MPIWHVVRERYRDQAAPQSGPPSASAQPVANARAMGSVRGSELLLGWAAPRARASARRAPPRWIATRVSSSGVLPRPGAATVFAATGTEETPTSSSVEPDRAWAWFAATGSPRADAGEAGSPVAAISDDASTATKRSRHPDRSAARIRAPYVGGSYGAQWSDPLAYDE